MRSRLIKIWRKQTKKKTVISCEIKKIESYSRENHSNLCFIKKRVFICTLHSNDFVKFPAFSNNAVTLALLVIWFTKSKRSLCLKLFVYEHSTFWVSIFTKSGKGLKNILFMERQTTSKRGILALENNLMAQEVMLQPVRLSSLNRGHLPLIRALSPLFLI